ncbi:DUF2125 domain-containing protein [Pontibaca methylaminivorans]|uniref:DUF2125 domain-containing protein n=1 Tax=Pontibaca methylaminivorans TaxID=515897 RepID=UPI002FD8DCFC
MTIAFSPRRGITTAVALSAFATAAHADLSAQQVWDDWRTYMEDSGYEVTGEESASGGKLTVTDVRMSLEMPDSSGGVEIAMPSLEFSEQGDGSVEIGLPESFPMQLEGRTEDDRNFALSIEYRLDASSMFASGDPGDTRYVFRATGITLDLVEVKIDGETLPADAASGRLALDTVTSHATMKQGDRRDYEQSTEADRLTYDVAYTAPDSGEDVALKGEMRGVRFTGAGGFPAGVNAADLAGLMNRDADFEGTLSFLSASNEASGKDEDEYFNLKTSSRDGTLSFAMKDGHLRYELAQEGLTVDASSNSLPMPVTIEIEEAALRLDMPFTKAEEAQDFSLSARLKDFIMAESVWALFDEKKTLPRDPANIALDLSGRAKLLFDYLNPEVAAELEESGEAPGEIEEINIDNLLVSMLGARLTGKGAFTFHNEDTETFDGFPRPEGTAEVEITGANGLLDRLIEGGFLDKDSAMGFRMMLSMFSVPGEGEDTVTSAIEVNDKGHVLANGQRLR